MTEPMQIHVVTPITSAGFRDDAPLAAASPTDCRLTSVFLTLGPTSVESAIDAALAAPGVIDAALRAERHGADAVVVDCMLDPGVDAAREAVGIPVVGCGEVALAAAAEAGPFAVVTVLDRQRRAFVDLVRRLGVAERLRSVRAIGVPVLALEQDREHAIRATIAASRAAVTEDGARAVVFGCTGMLGCAEPVGAALGRDVAVIDPLPAAVGRVAAAVRAGTATDKLAYPWPEPKPATGFTAWAALDRFVREGRT